MPPVDDTVPVPIRSQPGVKRDGTQFEGDAYVLARWCRFARGLPRKMLGYRAINKFLAGLVRTLHGYTQDTITYVHAGSANAVERFTINGALNTSIISDRTPVSGFTADDRNIWQFDVSNDGTTSTLVAQVAPNLVCICNSEGGALYTGDLFGTGALTQVTTLPSPHSATGGVVVLFPYTVAYGSNGFVMWSVPGDPTDFTSAGAGNANVTQQKILKGLPLRSGAGPAGILWSANSVIQMTYVGGTPVWQFNTMAGKSSVLSVASIIEYDGVYYWIGTDRFLQFNGVVREVPNDFNRDFFFDNLNYSQRQKVFAVSVPRFGEIWWCFPKGDSTEPDHAVVLNVREGYWYDTELPNGGRSAGLPPEVFRRPLMSGVEPQAYQLQGTDFDAAGSGYVVGDILSLVGGTYSVQAQVTVATVNGSGGVTGVTVSNAGSYTALPTDPVAVTGGTGTGAALLPDFNAPYKLWVHETGVDEVDGDAVRPIQSFYETADLSFPTTAQRNSAAHVLYIEPDFVQEQDMTAQIVGRANSRAPDVYGAPMTFPAEATTPVEQLVYLKGQRRQLRFRFESNTVGGYYEAGLPLAQIAEGDGTLRG